MDDAEEQAQADEEAEAAAAEALVETTLEMGDAKKCGLCYEWFEAEQMRWDAERTATSARTMRRARPAVRGREGASARGARAAMLACHEAPSMAGHTLVSFALELSVYACMCVHIAVHVLSLIHI